MSIRARLLLLILFATLLPAVIGGIRFLEYRESQIADAERELESATQQIAQALTDTVRSTAQLHYGLSRARDFDTDDRRACSEFLGDVLKEHPQYTGILTLKPDGELFCDSLRTGRKLNVADREYFQNAIKSKNPLAVEPVVGRLTGLAVLQIAYAVRQPTGEPKFVLLASLNLNKYVQLRAQSLTPAGAVIALVDRKGTILAWHPGSEKMLGVSIANSALFQFAREKRRVNVRANIETDDAPRIWATSSLPEFEEVGLHVLVGVPKNDLLAAANSKLYQSLAILSAVWMLIFAAAWALAERAIRRPTARIIETVTQFGRGNFNARVGEPYPRGEIGKLMVALDSAFGLMMSQREEIEQLNTDLERRVAQRTSQLEISIKELESFTYTVSHDLRAPLRAIDGFARMLLAAYESKLDDEGVRRIRIICANSQIMGKLIDDLLEFSRLGRNPLLTRVVDMNSLVRGVIEEIAQRREALPKLVVGSLPPALGDAAMLKQVFINLLDNAIKFSGKHEQPMVEVSGEESDGVCTYAVIDNGAGFDMKYYDKLFGVFQRLHSAAEFSGTGVGLAIVQRIVSRQGGRVWAESKVGEGAAFYFSLPAANESGDRISM